MNMTYCMFQNTLSELELSRDEKRSYDLMREFCQNFVDIAHRLDHAEAAGAES